MKNLLGEVSLLLGKSIGEGGSRFESTKHFSPLNLIDFWAPSCPCPAVERHNGASAISYLLSTWNESYS